MTVMPPSDSAPQVQTVVQERTWLDVVDQWFADGCREPLNFAGVEVPEAIQALIQIDTSKTIEQMQGEVFGVNQANGWFDDNRTFGEDVALLHTEVSEMFEAFRDHGLQDMTNHDGGHEITATKPFPKPEGVGSEAADIFIRLLDTCHRYGIDLRAEYERKIAYNETRGYKHGGKSI